MNRPKRLPLYVAGGAGLSALAAAVLGFGLTQSGSSAATVTASPSSTIVQTRDTGLGPILVDSQGRTLYLFAKDTGPDSTCGGSCASVWPPVPVSGVPHAANGAAASKIAVITRPGGSRQLSYARHPLYYFAGDNKAGQTSGQAIDEFGAKWYAVDSAGTAVLNAPSNANNGRQRWRRIRLLKALATQWNRVGCKARFRPRRRDPSQPRAQPHVRTPKIVGARTAAHHYKENGELG
jgi:predicted lipoprotein with Yx(FWY)xxD motif